MKIGAQAAGLVAVALVSSMPIVAAAQDAGFYLGASVGQTKVNDFCDGLAGSCDDTDVGWKIFGGYQFNKYLGVEGGYVDFGKATANGTVTDPTLGTFTGAVDAKSWGLFADVVGTIPIGERFGVFGKVGGAYTDTKVSVSGSGTLLGVPFSGSASASDSSFNLTFGGGAKFNFNPNFSIRVEWERFVDVGGSDVGEADVDLISAGLVFKF